MTYPLSISDDPEFRRCEFLTADHSTYFIDALFMGSAYLEFHSSPTSTYKAYYAATRRLCELAFNLFGPAVDDDEMVRWYWDIDRNVLYLRHENDLILLKLSW